MCSRCKQTINRRGSIYIETDHLQSSSIAITSDRPNFKRVGFEINLEHVIKMPAQQLRDPYQRHHQNNTVFVCSLSFHHVVMLVFGTDLM